MPQPKRVSEVFLRPVPKFELPTGGAKKVVRVLGNKIVKEI